MGSIAEQMFQEAVEIRHTPRMSFVRRTLWAFSSLSAKEFLISGYGDIGSYQIPRVNRDRGALICLRMTGSSVTIMSGLIRTGEPDLGLDKQYANEEVAAYHISREHPHS